MTSCERTQRPHTQQVSTLALVHTSTIQVSTYSPLARPEHISLPHVYGWSNTIDALCARHLLAEEHQTVESFLFFGPNTNTLLAKPS